MKKIFKWILILGGVLVVVIIAAMLLIPVFFDVEKYKPQIENLVTEQTGRSFSMGDDINVSVFPWVGVKLSDLRLGNPEGFSQNEMISIQSFEVRLKVMPLFSKRIEVKTFVVEKPDIFIERNKKGKANWEGIGKKEKTAGPPEDQKQEVPEDKKLPIEGLLVGNFSIISGRLSYMDQTTGMKKEVSDLNLVLNDISLETPVEMSFNAKIDGRPVSLSGKVGPFGKEPGMGKLDLDLVIKAMDQLSVALKGHVTDPAALKDMDLSVTIAPFSPRKLVSSLGQTFPIQTKDQNVLEKLGISVKIKGNLNNISLSDGEMVLDDSSLKFSAAAKSFSKPDLKFEMILDQIDLDRYLPEPVEKDEDQKPAAEKTTEPRGKTDYAPLRKLMLDGLIKVSRLKGGGVSAENINIHIVARDGIITIDPLSMNLYQGSIASKVELNVRNNQPKTTIQLQANGIQAGPLLKDAMKKELIEGTLKADVNAVVTGDRPEVIQRTFSGKGELQFVDGAIIGIDLANMVRNVTSKIGLTEKTAEKPRTDFAELLIPFDAEKGVVNTSGASLKSPLLRVLVTGKTNLVKQDLDFRVEPKFVATLKGQGDTESRSGIMVPVLITGSFTDPKIRPDLKGMLSGETPDTEGIKKLINDKETQKEKVESVKKEAQNLMKSVMPGLSN